MKPSEKTTVTAVAEDTQLNSLLVKVGIIWAVSCIIGCISLVDKKSRIKEHEEYEAHPLSPDISKKIGLHKLEIERLLGEGNRDLQKLGEGWHLQYSFEEGSLIIETPRHNHVQVQSKVQ